MSGDRDNRSARAVSGKVVPKLLVGDVIMQYAAICVRRSPNGRPKILLITSRGSRRWIVPKGWGIKNKKPHQVAKQEAWEEAGVKGRARKKPCGYYTCSKLLADGELVPAIVQVHLLEVKMVLEEFPERGQRQSQWFEPHEAAAMVDEPELKRLLTLAPAMINNQYRATVSSKCTL